LRSVFAGDAGKPVRLGHLARARTVVAGSAADEQNTRDRGPLALLGGRRQQALARLQPFHRGVVIRIGESRARSTRHRRLSIFLVRRPRDGLDALEGGLLGTKCGIDKSAAETLAKLDA
jgi:hypothetical protein